MKLFEFQVLRLMGMLAPDFALGPLAKHGVQDLGLGVQGLGLLQSKLLRGVV